MKYLIANLKTSLTSNKLEEYLDKLKEKLITPNKVIIAPGDLFLSAFEKNGNKVAAQNMFYEEGLNFTGSTTVEQIKNANIPYVILGHSEVRQYLKESNDEILKKVKLALRYNIKVILCVGETAEQRNLRNTFKVIKNQLDQITILDKDLVDDILIAYEPIWSIGTGVVPNNEDIIQATTYIKDLFLNKNGATPKVLYGGSVNRNNIKNLNELTTIDGFLVGTASYDVNHFLEIADVVYDEKK